MGFSPRMYELHLWRQDKEGDWWWEPEQAFSRYEEAMKWFEIYVAGGHEVRVVETKIVRAYEDGKHYV